MARVTCLLAFCTQRTISAYFWNSKNTHFLLRSHAAAQHRIELNRGFEEVQAVRPREDCRQRPARQHQAPPRGAERGLGAVPGGAQLIGRRSLQSEEFRFVALQNLGLAGNLERRFHVIPRDQPEPNSALPQKLPHIPAGISPPRSPKRPPATNLRSRTCPARPRPAPRPPRYTAHFPAGIHRGQKTVPRFHRDFRGSEARREAFPRF